MKNADDTPVIQASLLVPMQKLAMLVEHHPQLHSKLRDMLEEDYNQLEPHIHAADNKCKNEDSCPIYKLSNDELQHIFGYVGDRQYGFVAGTSYRFRKVYLETFGNETLTSIQLHVQDYPAHGASSSHCFR